MWPKSYRDYPTDKPLVKNTVEPGKGIVGCEMHDLNGWGNTVHIPHKEKKQGLFRTIIHTIFKKFDKSSSK